MRKYLIGVCVLALGLGSAQFALGSIPGVPNANNTIGACRANSNGALRAVSSSVQCDPSTEAFLTWQTRSFRISKVLADGQTVTVLNNKYALTMSVSCSVDTVVTGDVRAAVSVSSPNAGSIVGILYFQDPTYTQGALELRRVDQALTTTASEVTYLQARGSLGSPATATTDAQLLYQNTVNGQIMNLSIHLTATGGDGVGTCGIFGTATPT
jgi:hypothetical protein